MKRVRLVVAVLLVSAAVGMLASTRPAAASGPTWWNTGWNHRTAITVSTGASPISTDYSLSAVIDHATMVSTGGAAIDGSDLHVVYWNGSSWTDIDRVLDAWTNWNTSTTKIWFKAQAAITANSSDAGYYIYWGNASPGLLKANGDNVFLLYDSFDAASVNTSKWVVEAPTGTSVTQVCGQLKAAGALQSGNDYDSVGLRTANAFGSGIATETGFSIVNQSVAAQQNWKGVFGLHSYNMAVDSDSSTLKKTRYYSNSDSAWHDTGTSTMQGQTFTTVKVQEYETAAGVATHYENGSLQGTHSGVSSSAVNRFFDYSTDGTTATGTNFDVRFDYAMIRRLVATEPTTAVTSAWDVQQTNAVPLTATVAPYLTFAVMGRSSACNGVVLSSGASSDATMVNFGRVAIGTLYAAAQDLSVTTNAASGYSVYVSGAGTMSDGTHTVPAVGGSNASPAAFGSSPAFGYTTGSTTLSGTATRFSGPLWSAVTSTASEVGRNVSGPVASDATCVAFGFQVDGTVAAGSYSTTVVYQVVPTF